MKHALCILFFSICPAEILTVNVQSPAYGLNGQVLTVPGASYINSPGAPAVPCRIVTIALPPGVTLSNIEFRGSRQPIGTARIGPALPPLPLSGKNVRSARLEHYDKNRSCFRPCAGHYPAEYGTILSRGGLRKYTTVTVACFHFAYDPNTQILLHAPEIGIIMKTAARPTEFNRDLLNDITFDQEARHVIYNWDQARDWYRADNPRRANGYHIILPAALLGSVGALITHRQSQGYDVQVITREYIETNVTGVDLPQKFRNYLRANIAGIEYALLVGIESDMPWRRLVPFNNDPDSPWDDPDVSPIPSDLYLAELTDPDSLSWDSDRDGYYGEVYDDGFNPVGEDDPDYHADIRLGRIPFSAPGVIEEIIDKLIAFDTNTETGYKTAGLLTGALYYYANENNGGNYRMDGGEYCEKLLVDSILPRATAVTLYEKQGLSPCTLACTDTLNQARHIAYWRNKGVMYECHHGNITLYARKVWGWDDGDGIPENSEMSWPTSLESGDVYQLDNAHPATCFLRSCLCGKPEATGLGAMLLYRGGSDVISSSRITWASSADINGIAYHYYKHLLKDTLITQGVVGPSYDIARNIYMANTGFWLPPYHYNLFGDPALRQYGRLVGIEERKGPAGSAVMTVFPNPSRGKMTVRFSGKIPAHSVLKVHDVCGRTVKKISELEYAGISMVIGLELPAGIYFLDLISGKTGYRTKIVVME